MISDALLRPAERQQPAGFSDGVIADLSGVIACRDIPKIIGSVVMADGIDVVGNMPSGARPVKGCGDNPVNPPSRVETAVNDVDAPITVAVCALLQNLRRLCPSPAHRPYAAEAGNLVSAFSANNISPLLSRQSCLLNGASKRYHKWGESAMPLTMFLQPEGAF